MTRLIVAPSKYIQGAGELQNLGSYYRQISTQQVFVLVDPYFLKHHQEEIIEIFDKEQISYRIHSFGGECSENEIDGILARIKNKAFGAVIAIGGGKTLDTGKAVADSLNVPVVVVPTIAATDAPTSKHSVIYTEEGVVDYVRFYQTNPYLVLVDTAIIAKAPTRFLVSGMGDALATYIEARTSFQSNSQTIAGAHSTCAAQALARLSYDILLENGYQAKLACDVNTVSQALEDVVEANIFLSGVGFESGGLGAAHALHGGFTTLPETLKFYHGERVAFGVLVQLVLENAPKEEIEEVLNFLQEVGLPMTFADIGIIEVTEKKIRQVARIACLPGETIYSLPFEVTEELVYSALMVADKLGREKQRNSQLEN